jgi:uncharacterized protein (UPF0303 family)
MADSLGSLIDKLNTIDLKMYYNQDLIYEIRRMTFDDYKKAYFENEEGAQKLWSTLKKATDLNVQRNTLIDEIDEKIVEMIKAAVAGEDLDNGKFIQRKHKTY